VNFLRIIISFFISIFVLNCTANSRESNPNYEHLLKDCIDTFNDKEKCSKLISKNEDSSNKNESIESTLFIRSELKNLLFGKNTNFVIEKIGEPDEKIFLPNDKITYIYKKPITRYSLNHPADIEFSIVLQRGKAVDFKHKTKD
jgi:hypothetical protein